MNDQRRRPSFCLSLFTASFCKEKPTKPHKNYENGGVGLGILASVTNISSRKQEPNCPTPSSPNPIVSSAKPAANFKGCVGFITNFDADDEADESYTCVISHVGNDLVKKRIYYGDSRDVSMVDFDPNCGGGSFGSSSSVPVVVGEEKGQFWGVGFLDSCCLCEKLLHGLDIFMYRGEKAFCSTECREKHIITEDYWEKCRSEARMPHDCTMSPGSPAQVLFAGIAAA